MKNVDYDCEWYFSTRQDREQPRGNISDSGRPLLPSLTSPTTPSPLQFTTSPPPLLPKSTSSQTLHPSGGENILVSASGDKMTFSSAPASRKQTEDPARGGSEPGGEAFPLFGFRRSQSEGNLLQSKLAQVCIIVNLGVVFVFNFMRNNLKIIAFFLQ